MGKQKNLIPAKKPKKPSVPQPVLMLSKGNEKAFIYAGIFSEVRTPEIKTTVYFQCPHAISDFNGIKLKYQQFKDTDLTVIQQKMEAAGWKQINK